jgi:hypothetical protein
LVTTWRERKGVRRSSGSSVDFVSFGVHALKTGANSDGRVFLQESEVERACAKTRCPRASPQKQIGRVPSAIGARQVHHANPSVYRAKRFALS